MPAKMMSEIPLPIPRSLICSPSHMMKAVPVVIAITVKIRNVHPGSRTTSPTAAKPVPAPPEFSRSNQFAQNRPWIVLITIVP
jgi:hypothetical protein